MCCAVPLYCRYKEEAINISHHLQNKNNVHSPERSHFLHFKKLGL